MDLGELVLAAGAVGTAAMGITEGFKSIRLKPLGYQCIESELAWAKEALQKAYGDNNQSLLVSLYRNGRRQGELPRILRQGIRIGLDEKNAAGMASIVGGDVGGLLTSAATKATAGEDLEPNEKNVLGRFEIAADARIDAALSLAEQAYGNGIRFRAFIIALSLSLITAFIYIAMGKEKYDILLKAFIVGLVAVPLAPIAKDVANAFQSAAKAIGVKK